MAAAAPSQAVFVFDVERLQLLFTFQHCIGEPCLALRFVPGHADLLVHAHSKENVFFAHVHAPRCAAAAGPGGHCCCDATALACRSLAGAGRNRLVVVYWVACVPAASYRTGTSGIVTTIKQVEVGNNRYLLTELKVFSAVAATLSSSRPSKLGCARPCWLVHVHACAYRTTTTRLRLKAPGARGAQRGPEQQQQQPGPAGAAQAAAGGATQDTLHADDGDATMHDAQPTPSGPAGSTATQEPQGQAGQREEGQRQQQQKGAPGVGDGVGAGGVEAAAEEDEGNDDDDGDGEEEQLWLQRKRDEQAEELRKRARRRPAILGLLPTPDGRLLVATGVSANEQGPGLACGWVPR